MKVVDTALAGVVEVRPVRHGDDRGWFSEVWRADVLAEAGVDVDFVQDNESFSAAVGTLRGIHYQVAPHPQAKLVRVVDGSIVDVAVDLRRSSATFGRHVAVELTAAEGNQLLVPAGFGHGFVTTSPDTRVAYKVSGRYAPECERAVRWDDPELGIDWPIDGPDPVLSTKDAAAPLLADQPDLFDEETP
ncbi:dTDP-4-dehydrorhamnose 3,5-epimerase [Ilumatobacter sp.]|uniref:dTDP-4-dehydrorhamnose 3,5-epimerase n=1 Tax=Ilumatobacter sp. TaxID=1967498 RepID=UPI003B51F428